eukprot:scaffold64081_cov33-Prasinocladus_malaysianus.AAC.1
MNRGLEGSVEGVPLETADKSRPRRTLLAVGRGELAVSNSEELGTSSSSSLTPSKLSLLAAVLVETDAMLDETHSSIEVLTGTSAR